MCGAAGYSVRSRMLKASSSTALSAGLSASLASSMALSIFIAPLTTVLYCRRS